MSAKPTNLTARTLALFRAKGYICETVEKWKRFPDHKRHQCRACGNVPLISIRSDLFGFADILAVRPGQDDNIPARVFIQVTSAANHAARRKKILGSAEAKLVLLSGFRILVQSWRKVSNRWQPHDEWIAFNQFADGLPNTAEEFYEDERRKKLPDLPPGVSLPLSPMLDDESIPF